MIALKLAIGAGGGQTLIQRAIAILRRPGITANVYLPGIGTISGLAAANYLDSAGTTLSTVDQPVGLVLDAMGSVGVELVTNGDFSAGATGYSLGAGWAISGGVCSRTTSASFSNLTVDSVGVSVAGKTYQIAFDVVAISGNGIKPIFGANGPTFTSIGRQSCTLTAASVQACYLQAIDSGTTFTIDNISVREVTGIHATQPTTASKPRLERGVRNLLTWSSDFTNAAWTTNTGATKTDNGDGSFTLKAGTVAFGGVFTQNKTVAGSSNTARVRVRKDNHRYIGLRIGQYVSGGTEIVPFYDFDTDTVTNGVAGVTLSRELVGAGVVDLILVAVAPSTTAFQIWLTASNGATSGTTAGTEKVYAYRAQLEIGSTASDYSPTTTAAASNPNAGKYSWAFDGNDSLALGSVPFQMSDDHATFVAFKWDGVGIQNRTIFEPSGTSTGTPARVAQIGLELVSNKLQAQWITDAPLVVAVKTLSGITGGQTYIASARQVGTTLTFRVNGEVVGTASRPAGVVTLTGGSIGIRGTTTSESFSGSICAPVAIKGTLTDSEMLTLERFVSALTPNGPTF